jgi:Zn finger protein HypA/HybF involved in hydrogenase expression
MSKVRRGPNGKLKPIYPCKFCGVNSVKLQGLVCDSCITEQEQAIEEYNAPTKCITFDCNEDTLAGNVYCEFCFHSSFRIITGDKFNG